MYVSVWDMFLYYIKCFFYSERCPPQPEPTQVLQEGGEREGRRLDGGRYRVS